MTIRPLAISLFNKLPNDVQHNMKLSGVMPVPEIMLPLWEPPENTNVVVLIGGRGGMKTWGVSEYVSRQAAINKKRCAVLRDEKSRIRQSILNEILNRFDEIPFDTKVERQETGLKDKVSGKDLVFTMGFKASDNSKTANMKGVSDIDIAIIEEAEDIRDVAKFNSFTDGLRKEGCLIIIILNTPDLNHWILKRYFHTNKPALPPDNTPAHLLKDFDGYFEIEPKQSPGFLCIKTGYEDNPYLPVSKVKEYNDYGNPESDRYDAHHYMTAIKGYSSSGRKGQVLKKVKEISLTDYLALPFTEFYGQDFGPASPSPLVGVKFDKNNCYCREIDYNPKDVLEIGKLYCRLKFSKADRVIADNADKEAWQKLRNGWKASELKEEDIKNYPDLLRGFNVWPCIKNGVKVGIDLLTSMNLHVVKESENLWREIQLRIYAQDKNGEYTNEPEPGNDHAMDAWIYVATDQRSRKKGRLMDSSE